MCLTQLIGLSGIIMSLYDMMKRDFTNVHLKINLNNARKRVNMHEITPTSRPHKALTSAESQFNNGKLQH